MSQYVNRPQRQDHPKMGIFFTIVNLHNIYVCMMFANITITFKVATMNDHLLSLTLCQMVKPVIVDFMVFFCSQWPNDTKNPSN